MHPITVHASYGINKDSYGIGQLSRFMQFILFLIALVVCAFFGAILSVAGASLAGMPPASSGSWNLAPLLYMVLGIATVAVALPLSMVFLKRMDFGFRLGTSIGVSIILAFLSGVAGYPLSILDAKRNAEKTKEKWREERLFYNESYAAIRSNPGIVVDKQWYVRWAPQWAAYFDSLADPAVRFTPEMLSEIYQGKIYEEHKSRVLEHPAFDPKLLEAEFHRFFRQSLRGNDHVLLAAVLTNPQAKDEWFQIVAESPILDQAERSHDPLIRIINKWQQNQILPE